jgi:hypothetical protein
VIVNSAALADGRTVYFVFNWSWQPAQLNFANKLEPVLGNEDEIGAWGVSVFTE